MALLHGVLLTIKENVIVFGFCEALSSPPFALKPFPRNNSTSVQMSNVGQG